MRTKPETIRTDSPLWKLAKDYPKVKFEEIPVMEKLIIED